MALAESNRLRVSYTRETVPNKTPSPFDRQIARITGESINASKETEISAELRSDRMVSDLVEVGFESGGTLNGELSLGGTWDEFIESAVSSTFSNVLNTTGTVELIAATDTVELTGGFTNAVVGQWFLVVNEDDNTGTWYQIESITNNNEAVVVQDITADATITNGKIAGKMVRNGVTKHTYSIEKFFTDNSVSQTFKGQVVGKWDFNAEAKQIVTNDFEFMGTEMVVDSSSPAGTITSPNDAPVVNATSDMGCITLEGFSTTLPIKSLSFGLDNKLRNKDATCSKYAIEIGQGRQEVTGSFMAYFPDKALLDEYLAHNSLAISFGFVDERANGLRITFPKVKLSQNNVTAQGIDQDVMQEVNFTAIWDTTTNSQIQVDFA